MFRSARKTTPNVEVTKGDGNVLLSGPLLLEYKPKPINPVMEPKAPEPIAPPPATAPTFVQSPKGQEIERELKNILNRVYQANKNKKMHISAFRSLIAEKLRLLAVGPEHTAIYTSKMRKFYDELFKHDNEIVPASEKRKYK